MAETAWYYGVGGQQHGPVSQQQLLAMITAGQVGPKDLVWHGGMAAWAAVGTVAELAQPATAPQATWHYGVGGQQCGPVSRQQLLAMIASGQIGPADLVWRDGMPNWARVDTVAELRGTSYGAGASAAAAPIHLPYATPVLSYGVEPEYAGFWLRFAAYFLDNLIINAMGCVVGAVFGGIVGIMVVGSGAQFSDFEPHVTVGSYIIGLLIAWLYHAFLESSARQATWGKMAAGIIVTDVNGNRITFARASGRFFAKLLAFAVFLIGVIMVAFTERKQGLHDMMASTLVIRRR